MYSKEGKEFLRKELNRVNNKTNLSIASLYDYKSKPSEIQRLTQDIDNIINSLNGTEEFKKSLGYPPQVVFSNSSYNNGLLSVPYGSENIETIFMPESGLCYRFNTGRTGNGTKVPLITQSHAGVLFGLRLYLFTGFQSFELDDTLDFLNSPRFFMSIENQTEFPFLPENQLTFQSGMCYDIGIKKTQQKSLPSPYSSCVNDRNLQAKKSIFAKQFAQQNLTYSKSVCQLFCLRRAVLEECGCFTPSMMTNSDGDTVLCVTDKQKECSQEVYKYIYSKSEDKCGDDICPVECEQVSYDLSISSYLFPSPGYEYEFIKSNQMVAYHTSYSNQTLTYDLVKSVVGCVNLFYRDLKTTHIDDTPSRLFIDLVNGVGGALGLFTGVSLLSFFEIAEVFIEFVYILFEKSAKMVKP